jgi:hypothetical protein
MENHSWKAKLRCRSCAIHRPVSNVGSVDRSVRVVNLSAVGIGAERQRLRLEEALGYEPDLVILHVHGSNEYEDYRDHLYLENLHRGSAGSSCRAASRCWPRSS